MSGYSNAPKPRRGNRRVSGGGQVSGGAPRIASCEASGTGSSSAGSGGSKNAALSAEELARLQWIRDMKDEKPPHY